MNASDAPIREIPAGFGDRIRIARQLLGMSKSELSKKMGMTRTRLNLVEAGAVDVLGSTVILFGKVLGVTVGWLLADEKDVPIISTSRKAEQSAPARDDIDVRDPTGKLIKR